MANSANGFGVSGEDRRITGRTTNNSVQVAELLDNMGEIVDMHTYQQKQEVTEDSFLGSAEFNNEAIAGQDGLEVVSGHNVTESNTAFTTVQKTIVRGFGEPVTTITTPQE